MGSPTFKGTLSFVTLDVFTSTPYEGNPLAIIKVPASLRPYITQETKQAIAREFNLSESVFLHEQPDKTKLEWTIDIFTTNDELPFAGHPTIGTASYILGQEHASAGTIITKAGRIPIMLTTDDRGVVAGIPHEVHIHQHTLGDLAGLIPGLSKAAPLRDAELRAPIVSIVKGMTFLLVQLDSLADLAQVGNTNPDLSFHGVLDSSDGWDQSFVARYYYVIEGQDAGGQPMRIRTRMLEEAMEDPATGSAACALSCYLSLRYRRSQSFEIVQGVEMGRRSVIGVDVAVDGGGTRIVDVRLSGTAIAVMEGTVRI
jgi:PhzF family phenazine biosynthesis protein